MADGCVQVSGSCVQAHLSVLRALREIANAATFEEEPGHLVEQACATLVDLGGVDSCVVLSDTVGGLQVVAAAGSLTKKAALAAMAAEGLVPCCVRVALLERAPAVVRVGSSDCEGCLVEREFPGPRVTVALPLHIPEHDRAVIVVAFPPQVDAGDDERLLLVDVAHDLGNLTQMIQARRLLRTRQEIAEQELRSVFDASTIGKAIGSLDGRLLRVNPAFAQMLGSTVEELQGRSVLDITLPEDRAATKDVVRRLLAGECDTAAVEKRYIHRDGHGVWSLTSSRILRDSAGEPLHFIASIEDIGDRKRAEAAFAERDERLRLLMETMPSAWAEHAMVFDERGEPCDYVFIAANAAFERFTGLKRVDILGKPVTEIIPGIRNADPDLVAAYGEVVKTGKELKTEIYFAPFERWYGLSAFSRGGDRFVVMFEDVTARKLAEREAEVTHDALIHANAQLRAANEELEQFTYAVSHDLRQPLRAIDGFSRVVMDRYGGSLDATAVDYLRRVRAGAQRMGLLIDDLLRLSRLTRAEMRMETVDVSALAREAASNLTADAPERHVVWVIEEGLRAHGDRQLLAVVLDNLLGNAWKYTSKNPAARIQVGASHEQGELVCFVRDDGVGFDARYAHKLFAAFQRLHGVDEFPGTGIGLATVQRIVHRHGGRVWAESEPGRGATFYFSLPSDLRASGSRRPDGGTGQTNP